MIPQFENRVAQKLCEMQEQAIIELIELTGFNVPMYNLKQDRGARCAIDTIKVWEYIISQIE